MFRQALALTAGLALTGTAHAAVVFSDDFEDGSLSEYNVFGATLANPNERAGIINESDDPSNQVLELVNFNGADQSRLNLTSVDTFSVTTESVVTITADYLAGEAFNDLSTGNNTLRLGVVRDPGDGTNIGNRVDFAFLRTGGGTPRIELNAQANPPFTVLLNNTTVTDGGGNVAPADGQLVFVLDLFNQEVSVSFDGVEYTGSFTKDIITDLGGTDSFRAYISQDQVGNNAAFTRGTAIDNLSVDVTPIPEPGSLALFGLGALTVLRRGGHRD